MEGWSMAHHSIFCSRLKTEMNLNTDAWFVQSQNEEAWGIMFFSSSMTKKGAGEKMKGNRSTKD